MNTTITEDRLTAAGAPDLPSGFSDTFTSQFIDTGEVRLHAVIGGDGPPLLLVHGWPETWYAWRYVMPALAKQYTVIAVDQRGAGLSDKPETGYDTVTGANDLIGLMDALGHDTFSIVGHDTGFAISYAVAADHPERVVRAALIDLPGPPGSTPAPPLFLPAPVNNKVWHLGFNRVEKLPELIVLGNEAAFYGYEFEIQGGNVSADAIAYYVDIVSRPGVLSGSLAWYRAFDETLAQNDQRKATKIGMPVLAIGGERSYGAHTGEAMETLASDVTAVVIPGAGHWVAEEAPEALLDSLTGFLAPYLDARVAATV